MSGKEHKHIKHTELPCPRCEALMVENVVGDAKLDICTKCGAQYFDAGEMFKAFGMKADPSYWDRPETGGSVTTGELHCPQDHSFMLVQKVKYDGVEVEIDRCGKCSALFLDKGEAESIMKISEKLAPMLEAERAKAQDELAKMGDPFGSPGLIGRFLKMFAKAPKTLGQT